MVATGLAENRPLSIVSQNLNRLFDHRDDGNKEKIVSPTRYRQRLNRLVERIKKDYQFPDVLALQEVENLQILEDASGLLKSRYQVNYRAFLIEGNDPSGIDLGFLVKKELKVKKIKPLFADKTIGNEGAALFSRPPLLLETCLTACVSIVNLHLRSMRGLRSNKKSRRVAQKRRLQAETMAAWINRHQLSNPQKHLIVLGDFNALKPSDTYVDVVGIIEGNPDQRKPRWQSKDLVKRDLLDVTSRVDRNMRYSFIYRRKKQQLDYILASQTLRNAIIDVSFSKINYRFSDHAAAKAIIRLPNTQ